MTGLNCRPSRCKRDALPAELIAPSITLKYYSITQYYCCKQKVESNAAWFLVDHLLN